MFDKFKYSSFPFLKFIIGWPLSIFALFFILSKIIIPNWENVIFHFDKINPILIVSGILCFILYFFIRTIVWQHILREQGHHLSVKEISFLWQISELKRYIPGGIWGWVGRAYHFSNKGIPAKRVIKSHFYEDQFLIVGSMIIVTIGNLLSADSFLPFLSNNTIATILFILATAIAIIIIIFSRRIRSKVFNSFPPKTNIKIVLLASVFMFLFGLGTYLTLSSLINLTPNLLFGLISLFVLSLLIGHISILFPMGLGVREGVITLGLSNLISIANAGFASIFARVVLTVSEFIFLLLTFIWNKSKNKYITSIEKIIGSNKQIVVLGIFIFLYILYIGSASFLRHDNFYTGRFDLGNMDQTVWETMRGRIFQTTSPNETQTISRLSAHADFLLIAMVPLYFIWADPKMLLIAQTIVIAIGAYFVYLIAQEVLKNKNLSLVLGIAYLINPSLGFSNLYDFHIVTFATTFLLVAFYLMIKNKYLLSTLFLTLAGLTKENVWLITATFGIFFFFRSKKMLGLSIFIFSIITCYYLISYAIPNALGQKHFAFSYYSDFGESPGKIIKNIILSPHKIIPLIIKPDRLGYLREVFSPLGFLSFLSPFYLIFTISDFTINLISSLSSMHQIYYQYTATITPFIFISSIYGIKMLKDKIKRIPLSFYSLYILFFSITSMYFSGPLPFSRNPNIDMFTKPQPNKEEIEKYLSNIRRRYIIASTNNIGAHMSHRRLIYTIPSGIDKADYIIFLFNYAFENPTFAYEKTVMEKVRMNKNYSQIYKKDNFIVFKKNNLR